MGIFYINWGSSSIRSLFWKYSAPSMFVFYWSDRLATQFCKNLVIAHYFYTIEILFNTKLCMFIIWPWFDFLLVCYVIYLEFVVLSYGFLYWFNKVTWTQYNLTTYNSETIFGSHFVEQCIVTQVIAHLKSQKRMKGFAAISNFIL